MKELLLYFRKRDTVKRRIIASSILFVLFSILSLFGANNLHFLLSRQEDKYTLNLIKAIQGLGVPNIRYFFFMFLCLSVLFIGYMLVNQYAIKYKSDMQRITPDIETPKAEGQGQYGTARWLDKSKYERAFDLFEINERDEWIEQLILHGRDDLTEKKDDLQEEVQEEKTEEEEKDIEKSEE